MKLDRWSHGRVALVGDAAYCASPLSGHGATLATVGAYVLAGELARADGNHEQAFAAYERKLRPWVELIHRSAPDQGKIMTPESPFGIRLRNGLVRLARYLPGKQLLIRDQVRMSNSLKLDDYPAPPSPESAMTRHLDSAEPDRLPACVRGALDVVSNPRAARDRAALEQWWAGDARLFTNGVLRCDGIDQIQEHYAAFSARMSRADVVLRWLASDERCGLTAVEFELSAVPEGAREPVVQYIHAAFVVRSGVVAELRQVSAPHHRA